MAPKQNQEQVPILLLVFSNETKNHKDGTQNKRFLAALEEEKNTIIEAIDLANNKLEEPICRLEILEGKKANIQYIYDKFIEHREKIAVFHFAGHADGYQLLLQSVEQGKTQVASAGGLVAFFRQQANLKLIFLNGCQTYQQAKEMHEQGIPAVIGTHRAIGDNIAKDFAHRFYRSLALGVSLEHAWNDAVSIIQTFSGKTFNPTSRGIELSQDDGELSWDLFTNAGDWNLGSEAKNPLFGLPEPEIQELPPSPFRFLEPYTKRDAELFFGRGRETRQLFSLLISKQEASLLLFHGQSGVGKSSFLRAGLFPRLEARSKDLGNKVIYTKRDQKKGLLLTLEDALLDGLDPLPSEKLSIKELVEKQLGLIEPSKQTKTPSENPFFQVPQLVLLLDQAEEAFTRPVKDIGISIQNEWKEFLDAIALVILNPKLNAAVKIILSFRKEYHPEICSFCKKRGLKWEDVFLNPLDEQGIREVVMGIQSTARLREKYQVTVKEIDEDGRSFPVSIAEDLQEDKKSAIAPILQIQLSEMWEIEKAKKADREFSYDKYKEVKKSGKGKLEEYFNQQMEKLWKSQEEGLTKYIRAGLVLDLLFLHTTDMGTADEKSIRELKDYYVGEYEKKADHLYAKSARGLNKKKLQSLLDKLVNLRLLLKLGNGKTRLAHDTLAPYVRKAFALSDLPGQRAARILAPKVQLLTAQNTETAKPFLTSETIDTKKTSRFNQYLNAFQQKTIDLASAKADDSDPLLLEPSDLRLLEEGKFGMRKWNKQERQIVEHNRQIQNKKVKGRQRGRMFMVAVGIVIAGTVFWGLRNLFGSWENEKLLNANRLLNLADAALEEGKNEAALYYATQAYIHNFPNSDPLILKQLNEANNQATGKQERLQLVHTINEPKERTVISPDGRFVVNWNGTEADIISLINGKSQPFSPSEKGYQIYAVAFSPSGSRLAIALSRNSGSANNVMLIWDITTDPQLLTQKAFPYTVLSLGFGHQNQRIALGTADSLALIWNYQEDRLESTFKHDAARIIRIQFNADDRFILTRQERKDQLMNDGSTIENDYLWQYQDEWNGQMMDPDTKFLAFSKEADLYLAKNLYNGAIEVWSISENKAKASRTVNFPGRYLPLAYFSNQNEIIVPDASNKVWVFNINQELSDLFEFQNKLRRIQVGHQGSALYFYTEDGKIFQSKSGMSTPKWQEKNGSSSMEAPNASGLSGGIAHYNISKLSFANELASWFKNFAGLFQLMKFLLLLAFLNFFLHFFTSLSIWFDIVEWLNDHIFRDSLHFGITIGTIALLSIITFFLLYYTGNKADPLGALAIFGLFSLAFNMTQMLRSFQQQRYLSFYAWLFLFLGWLIVFGRFAFAIDKYQLFELADVGDILLGPAVFFGLS